MSRGATQTYGTNPSSTFNSGFSESEKPFGGREVDENLPNIWDFPEALKPGEKESPANPANRGKNFLDAFKNFKFGSDQNKYQDQAQRGGFQNEGNKNNSSGGFAAQVFPNFSVVQQQAPYQPFTVNPPQGGGSGIGSAIGTIAGIGASLIPGIGPGIAKALPAIGGTIGGSGVFG